MTCLQKRAVFMRNGVVSDHGASNGRDNDMDEGAVEDTTVTVGHLSTA